MDRDTLILKVSAKLARKRPPKGWWAQMTREIRRKNPDYSDEQVAKTVGSIWYGLSNSKVKDIKKRFYG